MKSCLLTAVAVLFSMSAFAQLKAGEQTVGAYIVHSSNEYDDSGLDIDLSGMGLMYQYYVTDNWVIEPSMSFFFPKTEDHVKFNMWEINGNVQYHFDIFEGFQVFPMVGLGLMRSKVSLEDSEWSDSEWSDKSTDFALNFGAGASYQFAPQWQVQAEAKYQVVDNWDRTVYSAGICYKF